MSAEKISSALADAYRLVVLSEGLLGDIGHCPFEDVPRLLSFIRKNLREAAKLINDAEAEFDSMIKEIDEAEEKELLEELEGGDEE